jgi:hypothetical protein
MQFRATDESTGDLVCSCDAGPRNIYRIARSADVLTTRRPKRHSVLLLAMSRCILFVLTLSSNLKCRQHGGIATTGRDPKMRACMLHYADIQSAVVQHHWGIPFSFVPLVEFAFHGTTLGLQFNIFVAGFSGSRHTNASSRTADTAGRNFQAQWPSSRLTGSRCTLSRSCACPAPDVMCQTH